MTTTSSPTRQPVVFLPHGGGPWPFVKLGWEHQPGYKAEYDSLYAYLQSVAKLSATPPKAVLVISGHWETRVPTVQTNPQPPLLYDYHGFPKEAYELTWPAPGAPELAARVRALLEQAGFPTAEDAQRGYDHGTFIPLKVVWPEAKVPTIQLSLVAGLDPDLHVRLGQALAPLRDEGVLIVGSGMTYHNLRELFDPGSAIPVAEAFDAWLQAAATASPAERDAALGAWEAAPGARRAHPREEHLIPLMVIAGAAGDDRLRLAWTGTFLGSRISAFATAAPTSP
jgi:aromatic ring-opening dioxygenase catalytic subunit (LigB family)